MNPKEFFRRWKKGMMEMTPSQQLHGRMVGFAGGSIGLTLAFITLIIRKSWGFAIFVFFITWIQIISYIGTRQQYMATTKIQDEIDKSQVNEILKEAGRG